MRNMGKKQDKNQKDVQSDDSQIVDLQAQIAELNEQLLRERSDAANVRRRAEEEKLKLGGFYRALVVKELFNRSMGF